MPGIATDEDSLRSILLEGILPTDDGVIDNADKRQLIWLYSGTLLPIDVRGVNVSWSLKGRPHASFEGRAHWSLKGRPHWSI